MADDLTNSGGGEVIGGVSVSITGDYSALQTAFNGAQDAAEKAGQDTAAAFNSGVSSVGDSADTVSEALSGIGDAAEHAAAGTDEAASSFESAGETAETAGSKLGEMAEQLAAIGEALVITEGLKEFGAEALSAADSITRASIALTTISGSADTAHETIEGLEKLGMADGLAMPSLLTAATRMEALLPAGTDVVAVLGHVADGAAAMGTDIEQAAQRFDLLVNAGTLSGRALTSMGLSLASVTAALNTVDPAADATTASVKAMFKEMDPGERIQVLQTALQSLGGTAQTVAEQTFGGQWQQLANAWESIMVQVGQAILPVISDLTSFLKLDVAPFVQEIVTAFNGLPEPLKDTAVAVGLAAAAIVPLTAALAAMGLAVTGLQGLLPAVTGLVALFGGASEEAAASETAEAAATVAMGEAATGAEASFAGATTAVEGLGAESVVAEGAMAAAGTAGIGLAAAVGVTLVAGLAAAAFGFTDLKTSIAAAQSQFEGISKGDFNAWLTSATAGLKNASVTTEDLEAKSAQLKEGLDIGAVTAKQYASAMDAIDAAMQRVSNEPMAASIAGWTSGLKVLTDTAQKATDQQTLLNQVVDDAQAKFAKVAAQYQAGTATAEQYIAAQKSVEAATNAVTSAQTAASNALMTEAIDQAKVDQEAQVATSVAEQYAEAQLNSVAAQKQELAALQDMAGALPPVVAQMVGLDGAISTLQSAMPGFGVIVTNLTSGPLVGLQSALSEASAKVADLATQMANGANVGQEYEKALKRQLDAQVALDQETAVLNTGLAGATDTISLATDAVAAAQAKVNDLTAAFQAGLATYAQVQSAQQALSTAQKNLNADMTAAGPIISNTTSAQSLLVAAMSNSTTAINAQTTALASDVTQLQSVAAAVQSIENDFASAFGTTSSSTSSSGVSLSGQSAGNIYSAYNLAVLDMQQASGEATYIAQQMGDWSTTAATTVTSLQKELGNLRVSGTQTTESLSTLISGGSTSSSSTTSSTAGTTSSTVSSAVDGGVYPAVTAHQASGEIWAVTTSGAGGTTASTTASTINQTVSTTVNETSSSSSSSTAAIESAAAGMNGIVEQIATFTGDLLPITTSLQTVAAAVEKVASSGTVTAYNASGAVSAGTTTAASTKESTSGSYTNAQYVATYGNPLGTTVGSNTTSTAPAIGVTAGVPVGFNPMGPTSVTVPSATSPTTTISASVAIDMRGANTGNTTQSQITQAVAAGLVSALRTAGARF